MDEVRYLTSGGVLLRFLNPPGLYPVNAYQSLVLAAACETVALGLALRTQRSLADLSVWEPCCGGGPVAVTLKSLGVGHVQASDVNPLSVAGCVANAAHNGLKLDRVCVADFLEDGRDTRFDLICCNPPCGVGPAVASIEERLLQSVDGGQDGMDPTLTLLRQAPQRLSPGGSLVFIAVSTGNIVRLARALDKQFAKRWRVLTASPVAAPWARADDPLVSRLFEASEDFRPIAWHRDDGWVWRLSWVIEVTTAASFTYGDDTPPATGFPLQPFGQNVDHDSGLQALIDRLSTDGFWLAF